MSVNDCAVGIFCITEHFVTKLGMVMQHHEPKCHAQKKTTVLAIFKVKVTVRAYMIKMLLFLLFLLNCWFFGNQT